MTSFFLPLEVLAPKHSLFRLVVADYFYTGEKHQTLKGFELSRGLPWHDFRLHELLSIYFLAFYLCVCLLLLLATLFFETASITDTE